MIYDCPIRLVGYSVFLSRASTWFMFRTTDNMHPAGLLFKMFLENLDARTRRRRVGDGDVTAKSGALNVTQRRYRACAAVSLFFRNKERLDSSFDSSPLLPRYIIVSTDVGKYLIKEVVLDEHHCCLVHKE